MKKILCCIAFIGLLGCSKDSGLGSSSGCGTHNGKTLYKGEQGGCYYIDSNGNKAYVSRSECKC